MVNLGHCYRKQHRWSEAIQVYERALGLCPGQASTYAALGFTKHLKVCSYVSFAGELYYVLQTTCSYIGLCMPEAYFTVHAIAQSSGQAQTGLFVA